ncbi:hypothetical protein ABEB36_010521 [Hypothenemus hampei]|uniref:Odorant receptor n=1 Tax=Hypothenemus hampei TaxID=57062 RepID=A0ABD1EK09_HYPHA
MFTFKLFLQYSGFYFTNIFVTSMQLIFKKILKLFVEQLKTSPGLYNVNPRFETDLLLKSYDSKATKQCIVLLFAICVCVFSDIFYETKCGDSIVITSLILHQYFARTSIVSLLYHNVFYLTEIVAITATVGSVIYFLYMGFHVKAHVIMLTDYICVFNQEEMISDSHICVELKVISRRYSEIKKYPEMLFQQGEELLFFLVLTGMASGLMTISHIYTNIVKGVISTLTLVLFSFIITDLLDYEFLSDQISTAIYDLKWYNWTIKCQKDYLILSMQIQKGIRIKIMGLYELNRLYLKQIFNTLYAILSFVYYFVKNT